MRQTTRTDVLSGVCQTPESTRCLLGINAGVHPGRPRGMRHHLPHTRGIGGRMLLLLLPLRAFGHGGTFKLIDGGIPAGALMDPIAAGVNHPRHLAIAGIYSLLYQAFHSASASAGTDMRPICNTGAMSRSGISILSG